VFVVWLDRTKVPQSPRDPSLPFGCHGESEGRTSARRCPDTVAPERRLRVRSRRAPLTPPQMMDPPSWPHPPTSLVVFFSPVGIRSRGERAQRITARRIVISTHVRFFLFYDLDKLSRLTGFVLTPLCRNLNPVLRPPAKPAPTEM